MVGSAREEGCKFRGKTFLKNNFPVDGVSKTLILADLTGPPQYMEQVERTRGSHQDSCFRISTFVLYIMKNGWLAVSPVREREAEIPVMLV